LRLIFIPWSWIKLSGGWRKKGGFGLESPKTRENDITNAWKLARLWLTFAP